MPGGDAGHPLTAMRQTIPLLIAMLLCACGTSAVHRVPAVHGGDPTPLESVTGAPHLAGTTSPSGDPPAARTTTGTTPPGGVLAWTGTGSGGTSAPGTTSTSSQSHPASQPPTTSGVCPPPPPPGSGKCPDPCTCPDYYITGDRWATDSSGHVTIHYRINPFGAITSLSTQQLIAAITAGAQAWMDADPVIQLIYDGTTNSPPALNNVVGFVDNYGEGDTHGGMGKPFDIQMAQSGWSWQPCDPAHAHPCTEYYTGGDYDLQDVATHEWGHVLGVNHPPNSDDAQLTMFGAVNGACPDVASGYTCRYADTLGYGDVLGLRALYPTNAPFTLYSP